MTTVSDVCWIPEGEPARCPDCGREPVRLGRVNQPYRGAHRLICIDCHVGPPLYFWMTCPACGWFQPGEVCEKCSTDLYPDHRGDDEKPMSDMIPW